MPPFISIIIPTYKDWNRLLNCIEAINNQTYSASHYEVIIVNNDPSELAPRSLSDSLCSNITILTEIMPGSYAARNAALKHAKGNIIAFTDSDCLPEADWLESAANLFQTSSNIDRIAGAISIFRENDGSWLTWKFDSVTAFNQQHNVNKGVSVTANLFVRRDVLDKVGSFNATLMSGGDMDWNKRATELGYGLTYSPQTRVGHPARKSIEELIRKSRRITGGGFLRAKMEKRILKYMLWHLIPPIRYAKILLKNHKKRDVGFAVIIFWLLKVIMLGEIMRLLLGGKPLR
ncbi:hypothetical protein GCM10007891_01350 [Methylophaga thalassica]|uniref:Glycosyltransferase 2-like domain-containing protein n=1 Tax=Methylophaga thalassica TaxID=40223 RepID=A0ABQ5TPG6_9GAMM|nr:glycosyltransferase [Methylophaga thalassica]GLP98281.1 hypothetical protein GCM10007891_01350 [Methylophaga thalassica]